MERMKGTGQRDAMEASCSGSIRILFQRAPKAAGKYIPVQPVNNLFDAIIINNHGTHGFFSLGKKLEQPTILELFLEGQFNSEARCGLHAGLFEVYLI